jgi:hypothetical protein
MAKSNHKKSAAEELIEEFNKEKSRFGRSKRWLVFLLGFSQCRYCVYCETDGVNYRGMRESALLDQGKCKWSGESITANLSYEDLRKYHRCPAFTAVLYNFKDYAINPIEVKNIYSKRKELFFTWAGWLIAILIAIITVVSK